MASPRGWVAALLVWSLLGQPSLAAYTSAQLHPALVVAHLELALVQLRNAERALTSTRAWGEAVALNLGATRQALYDAAQELAAARMATVDPAEEARLDALLAGLEQVRSQLEVRSDRSRARLRALQQETLELEQWVRAEFERREELLTR